MTNGVLKSSINLAQVITYVSIMGMPMHIVSEYCADLRGLDCAQIYVCDEHMSRRYLASAFGSEGERVLESALQEHAEACRIQRDLREEVG